MAYNIETQQLDFGAHLRSWRMVQGLTAQQVRERAGISLSTLRKLERGEGTVRLDCALQIARALGILDSTVDAADPLRTDLGRARRSPASEARSMTDVEVHVNREGQPFLAGVAHFTRERQSVTTTFTYVSRYLADPKNRQIDPGLPLFTGNQYVAAMLGALGDSAPDRWARNLLTRRERQLAAEESRAARTFDAVDFLLGVNDETRNETSRRRPRT